MQWFVQPQYYDEAYESVVPKGNSRQLIVDGIVSFKQNEPAYFCDYLPRELHGIVDVSLWAEMIEDVNSCLHREHAFHQKECVLKFILLPTK
jgi:hypothetical protein